MPVLLPRPGDHPSNPIVVDDSTGADVGSLPAGVSGEETGISGAPILAGVSNVEPVSADEEYRRQRLFAWLHTAVPRMISSLALKKAIQISL